MNLYSGIGEKIILPGVESMTKAPWDTCIHRGWINGATENTIPACYLVKENGYDWAEIDVRFSSDGVPVLAHNRTIISEDGETTLTVSESTLAELQAITLSTHERFGQIKMPTLAEVLDMARLIDLGILIDLKEPAEEDLPVLAQVVLSSGWSRKVVYMPATPAQAAKIAEVDKNASFDFIVSYSTVDSLPDFSPYQALQTGANTVGFNFEANITDEDGGIDTTIFDAIRAAGLSISFFFVKPTAYKTYMDAGPLRVTKSNFADSTDLDTMYFAEKTFW